MTTITTAELQANYYIEDAKAQYAVLETLGDYSELIGIVTVNYDGTADLTDIDAEGNPSGYDSAILSRLTRKAAARLFGEDEHFCTILQF